MITIDPKDVIVRTKRGSGPGGQHKNKTNSCVEMVHKPTGISVTIDGRSQAQNKKGALAVLQKRVNEVQDRITAARKKAARLVAIKNNETIRTYNYKRQEVVDHRTGKRAPLKKVLEEGRIDLLFPDDGKY